MDPLLTEDGKPYGIARYKEIVNEMYYITKNSNTSYEDIKKMTPTERGYMIDFISDEIRRSNEAIEKSMQQIEQKKNGSKRR